MIALIDRLIDRTTMYRLVLYYLIALLAAALFLTPFNLAPVDATALVFSAGVLGVVCWGTNRLFGAVFNLPVNVESALITALILALVLQPVPATDAAGVGGLIAAGVWAIAAKYILAIRRKHIFNPAALAVVLTGLLLGQPATWWIGGDPLLMPVVVIGGLMIIRKLQRFDLLAMFIAANVATLVATTALPDLQLGLTETLLHSPLLFLGFAMLTEPLTAPQARWSRLAYAAIVGVLAAPTIHLGDFYMTPELALLVGNVFAFIVSPKGRYVMTLKRIEEASNGAFDFIFKPDRRVKFRPGQYLEWTLGVPHADDRGNRRVFTIASAPGDEDVRLGIKFYPKASTFKRALTHMHPGETIVAAQLAGDFVMPRNPDTKLAFIAGGIGITPFRSMLADLLQRDEPREIVVLYGNDKPASIAYRNLLDTVKERLGIRTVYAIANPDMAAAGTVPGLIDADLIRREVPDFKERIFYLSGPHPMVDAVHRTLRHLGVPGRRIKTDFFPGLA